MAIPIGIAMLLFITPLTWGKESLSGEVRDTTKREEEQIRAALSQLLFTTAAVPERDAPLRLTSIGQKQIALKSPAESYPQLLKWIPGIYSTSENGSYGDAKINIRGFKQENISILLNGVPISGLVTGNMFWNNWLGLSDATHKIEVQKGIGSSMLSDNSVGGTINIVTKGVEERGSWGVALSGTEWGLLSNSLSFSTGKLKSGWGVSLHTSYTVGKGVPKGTSVNSGSYLLTVAGEPTKRSSLQLTILGSPDRHGQRSVRLSNSEVEERGLRYNKNWGYLNGKEKSISENFYHKPYITLSYNYFPTPKLEFKATGYLSIGDGGGIWSESKGEKIIEFQKDGQIDWEGVIEKNREQQGGALNILSNYLAGHTQVGLYSSLTRHFKRWSWEGGINYQHYTTWEKEQITDLLGGEWWYEEYERFSLAGVAGRQQQKGVGDYIRTYNGKIIDHLTLYSSANYKSGNWRGTLGASLMGSLNSRWDKYNYIDDIGSKTAIGIGAAIKGGVNRRVSRSLSLYLNGAAYLRAPYHNIFFSSGDNSITNGVKGESNYMGEGGVRLLWDRIAIEIGSYLSLWKNKSIISPRYTQPDQSSSRYLVRGLNALHSGVEATASWHATHWAHLEGSLSIGKWRWLNNVAANIYHPYSGLPIDRIDIYTKGVPVGDAPQLQIMVSPHLKLYKGLEMVLQMSYFTNNWADFNPSERVDPNDTSPPYKIPGYSLIDLTLQWSFKIIEGRESALFLKVNNLTGENYIERGLDGADHTLHSFRGFWGAPRYLSLGVRF